MVLRYWNSLAKNGIRNSCGDYSDESVAGGALIRSTPATEQHPTVGIAVNRDRDNPLLHYMYTYVVGRVFVGARGRRGLMGLIEEIKGGTKLTQSAVNPSHDLFRSQKQP